MNAATSASIRADESRRSRPRRGRRARRRTLAFLTAVLLSLMVMPVINILRAPPGKVEWREREFLFNIDPLTRWAARALVRAGISLRPDQVVVGRQGWFYLGNRYDRTREATRAEPTELDARHGRRVGAALSAWEPYLAERGVRLFRVVLLPNKETVYPEYLPDWATPPSRTSTDVVVEHLPTSLVLDLRSTLIAAKQDDRLLYYPTDTHWNMDGVGVAFHAMAKWLGPQLPGVRWPDEHSYEVERVVSRKAGDLANFLHLSMDLDEAEPLIRALNVPIETEQFDYDRGVRLRGGGNPQIGAPLEPLLVKSQGALNDLKVLFLRDSFGTALSPMMALTFSQTLHLHWSPALRAKGRLLDLVDSFEPDLVLVAIVERSAITPRFARLPLKPPASSSAAATGGGDP